MRDAHIFEISKRSAQNDAVLYRQFEFLETRMRAYELVLSTRKAMWTALIKPGWLKEAVDKLHMELLRDAQDKMREAVERAKEQSRKPKIQVVR